MFDRDAHWLDKLYRLIVASPGISLGQLYEHTKRLTSDERRGYLKRLFDAGKIHCDEVEHDSGHTSYHFWPKQPSASAGPGEHARAALVEAQQLFAAGLERVTAALSMLDQLSAERVSQPTRDATTDVQPASAPDGELGAAV
jgi:hypothetical protein